MTGTTTQIMIDVADVLRGAPASVLTAAKPRLGKMAASVTAFCAGMRRRRLSLREVRDVVFVLPPLIAFPAVFLAPAEPK